MTGVEERKKEAATRKAVGAARRAARADKASEAAARAPRAPRAAAGQSLLSPGPAKRPTAASRKRKAAPSMVVSGELKNTEALPSHLFSSNSRPKRAK